MRVVFKDADGTIDRWPGVIDAAPTGVTHLQRRGAARCLQRSLDGYYVPVGGVRVGGELEFAPELLPISVFIWSAVDDFFWRLGRL